MRAGGWARPNLSPWLEYPLCGQRGRTTRIVISDLGTLKGCCRNRRVDFYHAENFPYLKPLDLPDLSSPHLLHAWCLLSVQPNQGQDKEEIWMEVSWIFRLLQ